MAALVMLVWLLPASAPGEALGAAFAQAPEAHSPPGFENVTNSDRGRQVAAKASNAAQGAGQNHRPDDFDVFRSTDSHPIGRGATIAVDKRLRVNEIVPSPEGKKGLGISATFGQETIKEAQSRDNAPRSGASADAATNCNGLGSCEDTTGQSGSGTESSCAYIYMDDRYAHGEGCFQVVYEGYSSSYYYYSVKQSLTGYSKNSADLYDMDIRVTSSYGMNWAGTDAHEPAGTLSKNCQSVAMSVNYGSFGAGISPTVCETWSPSYDALDDYYYLDWNGQIESGIWRELQYVLLQRKYRCKCWQYDFFASVWAS